MADIEKEETADFVSDPRAEVTAYHAVPIGLESLLEGSLHELRDSSLVEGCLEGTLCLSDGVFGHLRLHVIDLNDSTSECDSALRSFDLHILSALTYFL